MMVPKTIDILDKGLEYIEKYGWVKSDFGSKRRGFCVLGALREADEDLGGDGYTDNRYTAEQYLARCLPYHLTGISGYNDARSRTKTEIIDLFKCAIEKAQAASDRARHAALSSKKATSA